MKIKNEKEFEKAILAFPKKLKELGSCDGEDYGDVLRSVVTKVANRIELLKENDCDVGDPGKILLDTIIEMYTEPQSTLKVTAIAMAAGEVLQEHWEYGEWLKQEVHDRVSKIPPELMVDSKQFFKANMHTCVEKK